jgi:membrane-anchored protein YejM (alkaline phosphatase superfamily)
MYHVNIISIRKRIQQKSVRYFMATLLVLLISIRIISALEPEEVPTDITKNDQTFPIKVTGEREY